MLYDNYKDYMIAYLIRYDVIRYYTDYMIAYLIRYDVIR